MTMTCFFKLRKVAAAGRKLFALIFLFLSSPYVKLSDFFWFVSPIALLHTIFIRMSSVLVLLLFLQYLSSILTRISKTPQDFWWETGDLVRYFILLVDAVKNAREANLLVVGLVDWRALVLSLKEALAGSKAFFFNFCQSAHSYYKLWRNRWIRNFHTSFYCVLFRKGSAGTSTLRVRWTD